MSTALSDGSSGSSVSRSSRIATMVAVPLGAMLMRRKSSCRGGSTATLSAMSVSQPGAAL